MLNPSDYLEEVGQIVTKLKTLGFTPVLVGGMALAILGSRRVTRDFDFLLSNPSDQVDALVDVFYEKGLELAGRLDKNGEITATIDNRRVAAIRLRLDAPSSAYFFNVKTGLRVDLLFDFPVPASEIAERAQKIKVRSHTFNIASESDLIRLKELAHADRASPNDAQDIKFLKSRRKNK